MRNIFYSAFQRALSCLTRMACRAPRTIVALALLASASAAWYSASNLKIDTDTSGMLSETLRYRQLDRDFKESFPKDHRQLIVVVEGENPDLVADSADLLAEVLRNRPDLFATVLYPRGDPFFRRNGLLFATTDELYSLSDRLADAQPFLGALWRDRSMRGFFDMLSLAADHADGATSDSLTIASVLDAVADVAEAEIEHRFARLSWIRLMTGAGADGVERRLIIVQPALDFAQLRPSREAIETIQSIAADLGFDGSRDVRVRLTGTMALRDDELQSVTVGMSTAGALSLTLVVVLLLAGLRSPRTAGAALVTLLVGLVLTTAFAVATVGALNLISVAFAVLFIGLSVDFSIHYALRFREEFEHLHDPVVCLQSTVTGLGGALTLGAVAAAIGFISFVPTDYTGLAELGIIAAAGMIIALLLNLTLLPALIMLVRPRFGYRLRWESDWQGRVGAVVAAHAKLVAVVAVLLGLGAAVLVPRAFFDFDPLNLKDPESPSVSTLLDLMAEDPRQGYAAMYLAEDLEAAEDLAERLDDHATIAETLTLSDFVPTEQDEKREIVETLALVLEPALTAPRLPHPTAAETQAARARLHDAMQRLTTSEDEAARAAAVRLSDALTALDAKAKIDPSVWKSLEARLLSGLSRRLEDLRDSLHPGVVDRSNLPDAILDRWMTPDGRARLEVYPAAQIHRDREALLAFLNDVRTEIPDAVGAPVEIYEGGRTVVRAFLTAAAIAIVVISAMLLVLLRSVRATLVIFSPLILAAVFTIATSVLLKAPFNFANVIVLPLLFGLGVAGSLHIVLRQRAHSDSETVLSTSTPRAVLFSALTTIASFVSLNLSEHPGTASMGMLLTIALIFTMICTLLVLPAVMTLAGVGGQSQKPDQTPR